MFSRVKKILVLPGRHSLMLTLLTLTQFTFKKKKPKTKQTKKQKKPYLPTNF